MSRGDRFIGGMSTKPEVDELMKIDLIVGTCISFDQVERLINAKREQPRFNTVTNAWRKKVLREKEIRIDRYDARFHFLTADAAHDASRSDMRRSGRAAARAVTYVQVINANAISSDEKRQEHFLMKREAEALLAAHQAAAKVIAAPRPIQNK
jgi:hypothetical protein